MERPIHPGWWSYWVTCSILGCVLGCNLGGRNLSPDVDTELMLGAKNETSVEGDDGSAGGVVGTIGGGGDSVALWLAILALGSYPLQRQGRLAWNSWRGRSGKRK